MTAITVAPARPFGARILQTAARGAVLIGIAVILGIVLLQVVDEGSTGPSASSNGSTGGKTTTTTNSGSRPPQEISVAVYNASGVSGAAATLSNQLRGLGYQTPTVENYPSEQAGTTVACQAGYEKEAEDLITIISGSTLAAFLNPPPAGAENVNCYVIKGK